MAEAAVSFLLQNLKDIGVYIYTLRRDADDERQGLLKDLETIQAKLEDAASSKSSGKEFRVWENRIRDVVYEADDLIEDFASQELADGNKKIIWRSSKIDLAAKLKEFRKKKIQSILHDPYMGFPPVPSSSTSLRSDETNRMRQVLPLTDKTVVGFEDVIETLIANVMEPPPVGTPGVEVISITGMPGLGKTTVAWKIFSDPKIQHEFPTRIWIDVSQEYKPRNIYLKILKKFTEHDFSNMDDRELPKKAEEWLTQVKFLLVVDDVWTKNAWNDIKVALPMTKGSGKVLMTSRDYAVALYTKTHELRPHRLRFLRDDESWKLLQYEVYGNETQWPSDSMDIGRSISKKCGGLPLAIVVIGGILKEKIDPPESRKAEWSYVSKRTEEYFMGEGKEQESMEKVIELSYNAVPYSLRDCFLYFGVYPNNQEISVWKLTRLWIAEGFIKEKKTQTLEEVAVDNLKELIRRNLVMDVKRNRRGEVKACRVHDMIREFCKKKANDEKLFQFISKPSEEEPFSPSADKHENVHPSTLKSIVDAFERLRILEVSEIKFPKYDAKLTKLNHLRYISLAAGEGFKSLPEAIASLWSLQTIVIDTSHHIFEIKADVGELRRLRHVKTKASIVFSCTKKGGSNKNLHTLDRLSAASCKDGVVLSKTPNLQTLVVCGDLASLVETTCFKDLKRLTKMKMIKVSERQLGAFLVPAYFPPNLKILTLSATNLEWSYMSTTLGRLPLLEVLKLKDNAFKGDEWKVYHGEFSKIQYLHIDRSNLSMWIVEDGSFPQLTTLVLNNSEKLSAVPFSLAKTLQTLEMGRVPMSAKASVEKISEEKRKRNWGELKLAIAPGT